MLLVAIVNGQFLLYTCAMPKNKQHRDPAEQGTGFYREEGLKAILVHVPKSVHRALISLARREESSLHETVRRILTTSVKKQS